MRLVIKLGGSILFSDGEINYPVLFEWINIILNLAIEHKVAVVVGGGAPARKYISWARQMGLNEFVCDILGISVSRLNAYLLLAYARSRGQGKTNIFPEVPKSPQEVYSLIQNYDLIFCGGFIPGQSTIGVSAEVAEAIDADYLLVATNVDGIYDKDPRKYSDAKLLRRVHVDDLIALFSQKINLAGTYALFDIQALKIIKRAKIRTIVLNGKKLSLAKKVIFSVLSNDLEALEEVVSVVIA